MNIYKKGIMFAILVFSLNVNSFGQDVRETENDFGVFINGTEELYDNALMEGYYYMAIIEKEFTHPVSGCKIYYTGTMSQGDGQYWIYKNGEKQIILEGHFRYGPWIQWFGEYLAGIDSSSANIRAEYFYDFMNNTLSDRYSFILYVDADYNNVITAENRCLAMYNLNTDICIQRFIFDDVLAEKGFDGELNGESYFYHPLNGHEIVAGHIKMEKPNKNILIIEYDFVEIDYDLKGKFVYTYNRVVQ